MANDDRGPGTSHVDIERGLCDDEATSSDSDSTIYNVNRAKMASHKWTSRSMCDINHYNCRCRGFDVSYATQEGFIKLILSALILFSGLFSNAVVQAIVADEARNMSTLPDIFFQWEEIRTAESVMNWVVGAVMVVALINTLLHQYRFVVIRRIFVIAGFLYFCRGVTLAVTPLPPSYSMEVRNQLCTPYVPPENRTIGLYVRRVVYKILSGGQGTAGVCGDMLFSGHTMVATTAALFAHRYTPRPLAWRVFVQSYFWLSLAATFVLLLLSHAHYTIDIIFGYWLAIGTFVLYHMYTQIKPHRRLNSEAHMLIVTYLFQWMERDTPHGRMPNAYNWPLPWPQRFNEWLLRNTCEQTRMADCERIPSESSGEHYTEQTQVDATTPLNQRRVKTHHRNASSPAAAGTPTPTTGQQPYSTSVNVDED